jgi:AcrR family transcriptional regulator
MATKKERRTQEERTAAMRHRLLEATVDCLYEQGYAGTTTTAVAERAGVSRGAQLHHFPTKAELVATSVEYVMERRLEEFKASMTSLPETDNLFEAVILNLWDAFKGRTFYAWLELLVAARTDPALQETVSTIARAYQGQVEATFREVFGLPADADLGALSIAPRFTFLLMEGMALERIRVGDPDMERKILKALMALAPMGVSAAGSFLEKRGPEKPGSEKRGAEKQAPSKPDD